MCTCAEQQPVVAALERTCFRLTPHAAEPARIEFLALAVTLHPTNAVLEGGERVQADMFVCAAGCRYNLQPEFLKELGIGE